MARSDNLRSIFAMLLAVACFSLMDTALKLLSAHYPVMQVAALRGFTTLPLVLLYVLWRSRRQPQRLRPVNWPLHLLRGVLIIAMLSLFSLAVRELSLANAYTIFFIAPLLITMLSAPVLKERVPRQHWWAIALGLLGVVVALRPDAGMFLSWGSVACLGAALCYAVSATASRLLVRTDSTDSMILSVIVMLSVGAGLLAAPGWVTVRPEDAATLLGLAVSGFLGLVAITAAFSRGQASAVAPFEYTALAWGIALDWLLWQTLPDARTLLGGAIVIASGIYLLRHEKTHAQAVHP